MKERIRNLANRTLEGKMFPIAVTTEYDREDLFLHPVKMSAKRVSEYILNQEPIVLEECAFTGLLTFDGSVEGDVFNRRGHKAFQEAFDLFYNKPIDNLSTFEWQHSTGDFEYIIKNGIKQIKQDIKDSLSVHENCDEEKEFLLALQTFTDALIGWAHKCSCKAEAMAKKTQNTEYKANLNRLSQALLKVPEYPAENFYEAVLSLYVCYAFVPDSIGLIDRYLYPYYLNDIKSGRLTKEDASSYLQELFLMLQGRISIESDRFYRGGESHFAIGGYTPDGEDGFNELSRLIVDSLMELPTYIPQISLRWTKKTPHEVFRYMMDCERHDPNKRIAFVSDEPKIKAFTENLGMTFEEAINYIMVGCNEVAFPGGIYMGSANENIARSLARTLHNNEAVLSAKSFDEFYQIYEAELYADLAKMLEYEDKFNAIRTRDVNIVSSIFFKGCIENAKSVTCGGASKGCSGINIIGLTNVIDSLAVIKQFVFDEKVVSMKELCAALSDNWNGHEELLLFIKKRGNFFGNDDETSNYVAERFTESVYRFLKNRRSMFGHKFLVGCLTGYNEHHKFFGELTPATPDGRSFGENLKFGLGQAAGYDREGLSALLNSISKCDPHNIMNGPTVTNVTLDQTLLTNNDNFEKTVDLFETYFKNGGIHFQLSYVSTEDLLNAKVTPDNYKHLRVRVSGFSDYFVLLNEALQDDVIARTTQKG